MKSYAYLENDVEMWGYARGIIQNGTALGQAKKTLEETNELLAAIAINDRAEIIDAIGDIVVTLIMQCGIQKVTLTECLEAAYNQIKDRKGFLNADGIFVKDE
jgi:phosphoribosyl-ATP pyrophosphohydrolase